MTETLETEVHEEPTRSAMFSTREVPWMKLGTPINEPVDAATAARLGHMDFTVSLKRSGYDVGDGTWRPNGRWDVVADDTGESFDTATDEYKIVQFGEAFAFMDKVNPRFVAAGTLMGRKQGFMVTQLPGAEHLNLNLKGEEDPHELYAVLRTSHNRSRGLEIAVMALRGKCMNQLTLRSFTHDVQQRWSIRHVGNPQEKLIEAGRVLHGVERYAEEYASMAEELVEIDLLVDEVQSILKTVLPDKPKRDDQVNAIVEAWRTNTETVGFNGTGWGLVQATSEYFEWGRESGSRTPQSRLIGGLDGDTHKRTNGVARAVRTHAVRRGRR